MKLEVLQAYNLSMKIGEKILSIGDRRDYIAKDTMAKQFVRAIDSLVASLSEGFGWYHFSDSRHFGYYSRGSLYESKTWITKSNNRNLINENDYKDILSELNIIAVKLNNYIKSIGRKNGDIINEAIENYGVIDLDQI
ncbi:MAG: four helix bundle protein [Bacteroidales bacterium]|nr:four helix bundle protein [Bacteroidales bacterium]